MDRSSIRTGARTWERPIPLERRALPLAVVSVAVATLWLSASARHGALREENARLRASVARSEARERELEGTIVRQQRRLLDAQADLDVLERELEAVELQVDGIDYLGSQLRRELGLPPAPTTFGAAAGDGAAAPVEPQGGGHDAAPADALRAGALRGRLAAGLAELYMLRARAAARSAPDADGAAVGAPAAAPPAGPAVAPANWPARGAVTSRYGWRLFRGRPNHHAGIDIGLPYGSPIQSTGHGTVVGSGWQPGYGWSVLVQHAGGFSTLYAHLSSMTVTVGDAVVPGDLLGFSGSSGNSTGPHLHYEIWQDGQPLDPRPLMDGIDAGPAAGGG